MAKANRELIKLNQPRERALLISKNRKTMKDKLVLKKYDPRIRKHVEFKETKLK